jgi:hypothetical protein
MSMLQKAVLGVALSASALSLSAPAEAQRYGGRGGYYGHHGGGYGYRGGYRGYRGGNGAGLAVGAGILGLAVGAAIASNNRGDRYYDRGYRGGYYQGPVYRDTYYYDGPRYRDYRSCWSERVWDEYRGGWGRIQRCR